MKNLKRILALVLCLSMLMGLSVSASATSFTDDESISEDNATAVEVLSALGIINGYEDGSFRPSDTVTRAEVCKMIAVAFNGGDESINDLYANVAVSGALTDVYSGYWAEGYIKYCYATGIVDGYPDGTFLPEGEITGLELCQIMLNILNYEVSWGDSTPWATAVMAKSATVGLLQDVSTAVGSAIPRQEAAQVIFNSLTLPIQGYNALGVRIDSDDTILSTYLNGSQDTVIIIANEYASLEDNDDGGDEPLEAGLTLTANGDTLEWSTTLDMIGSAWDVWQVDDTIVYYEEAEDNTVAEITTKVKEVEKDLSKECDLDVDDDTEYYINFDNEVTMEYEAEIRIRYVISVYTDDDIYSDITDLFDEYDVEYDDYVKTDSDGNAYLYYAKTIADEDTFAKSSLDYALMKFIFNNADYEDDNVDDDDDGETYVGAVYVGTQSTDDISDEISFSRFLSTYTESSEGGAEIEKNERGNYLRVIDNDGDGYADYVLKTEYTMAVITDISDKGELTISVIGEKGDLIDNVGNDDYPLVTDDELEEDDVIVYAFIDTVYYVNLAEVVTVTVEDIDYADDILTADDGTEYNQSAIEIDETEFADAILDRDVLYDITDAEEDMEYDLYLDNYGNVRALMLSDASSGYGLLTDAYYGTNGRTETVEVTMYAESEDSDEYTVKYKADNCDWELYVDTEGDDDSADYTWGRLIAFGENADDQAEHGFVTNVALYSGNVDGLIISDPETSSRQVTIQAELVIDEDTDIEDRKFTTVADADDDTQTVYATSDTLYYYVEYWEDDEDDDDDNSTLAGDVTVWTGYSNGDSYFELDGTQIVYTIAHQSSSSDSYYVADVIVIEETEPSWTPVFAIDITKYASARYYLEGLTVTDGEIDDSYVKSGLKTFDNGDDVPAFYYIDDTTATQIKTDFSKYNIYAAESLTSMSVNRRDYVYLSDGETFKMSSVTVYKVDVDKDDGGYELKTVSKVYEGDELIYVTNRNADEDDNVLYVIDVSQSNGLLDDLYALIEADQEAEDEAAEDEEEAEDEAETDDADDTEGTYDADGTSDDDSTVEDGEETDDETADDDTDTGEDSEEDTSTEDTSSEDTSTEGSESPDSES